MHNLNFKLEDLSSVSKKLRVEIPYTTVKERMERALISVSKDATIKGFRKGKAPQDVVNKVYADSVKEDVVERLISETYAHVVKEKELRPVSYPKVSNIDMKEKQDLVFEATFDVKPIFDVKDYKELKLDSVNVEPTDDEVNKIVQSFLESRSDMKTIMEDRSCRDGDWIEIDFDSYIDGQKKEEMTTRSYVCRIGDKATLIDDLSKGIAGMKVGQ